VRDPCRLPQDDLDVLKWDQLQALAAAEIVDSNAMRLRLKELVVAVLFQQSGRHGHQRRGPMRLLALDPVDAREPVKEIFDHRVGRLQRGRLRCGVRQIRTGKQRKQDHKREGYTNREVRGDVSLS
jgi:hypothetical protein